MAEQSFASRLRLQIVQLLGVPHPSPSKGEQFRSVVHPAPMMKDYIEVRMTGEALLRESGLNATILRPWYVVGPGHRWPYFLIPFYWICECLLPTREGARRPGLVTLKQMLSALVPPSKIPLPTLEFWTFRTSVQVLHEFARC